MNQAADPLYWPVYLANLAIWVGYGLAFLARRRPPEAKRARTNRSIRGIAIVGVGFMLAWALRRHATTLFIPASRLVSFPVEILAVPIGIASVWLTLASIRTLGKQWSLKAVLVTEHQLITNGPYARVRHPLYTGMLGLMLATSIANATWWGALLAMAFGIAGTLVRIRYEEALLREAFGAEFEIYQRRVPALWPSFSARVTADERT